MNAHSLISRSYLLLVFLLSIGCTSAYRELLKVAQQAADRGDFLTAARFYRKVCDDYPTDELACGQAPIFAQKAAAQAVERARPVCEAGELDLCLRPLFEAQQLVPDHAEITALIEQASQLHAKRCAEWSEGPLNTALAGLACLQARAHQFPSPHYQSLISQTADRLALRFVEYAGAADDQAMSGASAVLWSAAQCLSPGTDHFWPAQQARKNFLDSSSIPVLTYLGGSIPTEIANQLSDLCPHLSPALPAWAQCMKGEKEAYRREVFHLQVDAVIHGLKQTVDPRQHIVDVVTDTKQVKNPAYERAEKQLQSAEVALQQAEQQRQQAAQTPSAECSNSKALSLVRCKGCSLLPEKSPCLEMAAENYRLKANEYKKARENLTNTSTTVEQKITVPFKYTVSYYTWTSDFYFTIHTNTPGTVIPLSQHGVLTFTDKQQFRSELANIQEDPFEPPTNETFAKAFLKELTPQVVAAVQRDGEQRGFTRRAQCKELPADFSSSWMQCWAEASLWESGKEIPADTFLQLLASSAGSTQQVKCR